MSGGRPPRNRPSICACAAIAVRTQYGRVAGITDHMDVLKYAAGVRAASYQPGTIERGPLEQFAAGDMAYQDETP